MFSQKKVNDQLIVVETGNNFKTYRVQVTEVGQLTTSINESKQAVQVVSVIKATDGQQPFEFKELPSNATVYTYPNGTIVAVNQEVMAAEMKRLKNFSTSVIQSLPHHQAILVGTESVLEEIDPEYAEKKRMREQLALLTQQNEELKKSNEEQKKANEEQAEMMREIREEMKSLRQEVKTSKKQ